MSFLKSGVSAIGKLLVFAGLAAAFGVGLIGAVFLSLRGEEVKVPEIVGKDFGSSEQEIEGLGLKIKKRATRYSQEKPNTVLEQLPKAGDTVKSGQTILVVISEQNPEGTEAPATLKKGAEADEPNDATDLSPEKAVKTNKNTNVKKPAQTTRDVSTNKNKNSNTASGNTDAANKKTNSNDADKPANKTIQISPANKTETKPATTTKTPAPAKTPGNGDVRNRRIP